MTTTRIVLAATLLIGTATAAMAQEGMRSNGGKRHSASASAMKPAPMRQDRNMSTPDNLMMNVMDRASAPFACGG